MTTTQPTQRARPTKYKTKYKYPRKAYVVRLSGELAKMIDVYAGIFTSDEYKNKYDNVTINDVLTAVIFNFFFDYDQLNNKLLHYKDVLTRLATTVHMVDDIDTIMWEFTHTPLTEEQIALYVANEIERERSALDREARFTQYMNSIVTKRNAWVSSDDETLQASIQEARERIELQLEAKRQQLAKK